MIWLAFQITDDLFDLNQPQRWQSHAKGFAKRQSHHRIIDGAKGCGDES
jgi:hypothetical protein